MVSVLMIKRVQRIVLGFVPFILALTVCFAVPPRGDAQEPEDPGFLFTPDLIYLDMIELMAVGLSSQPGAGPLGLVTLHAGGEQIRSDETLRDVLMSPWEKKTYGASSLFLNGFNGLGPAGAAVMQTARLHVGHYHEHWILRDPDLVRALDEGFLSYVKDNDELPKVSSGTGEVLAFSDAVNHASKTSTRGFHAAARPEVTFAHLVRNPKKHRGEVVLLRGTLARVRQFDALTMLRDSELKELYEGWIFYEGYGNKAPFCVIFTELPRGVKVAEEMDVPVEFAGYFFKMYRYQPAEKIGTREGRVAPLLIGRSPVLFGGPLEETQEPTPGAARLLPILLITLGVVSLAVFVMGYLYRRNDRAVERRLVTARFGEGEKNLPFPEISFHDEGNQENVQTDGLNEDNFQDRPPTDR